MTGEHSSKQYDQELEAIRSKVLLMGGMVETQFDAALECFRVGDVERAERVIAEDQAVNQLEVSLDDACSHLITDLERIGDEATKVARIAKGLHERGPSSFNHFDMIRTISKATCDLLHDALDAFARLDGKQALQLIAADEVVDHEFRTIMRTLVTFMMEDPRTISNALDTLWVAKAIERIGDHAKNIAEYVIYVVEGRDIRHSKPAALEQPGA